MHLAPWYAFERAVGYLVTFCLGCACAVALFIALFGTIDVLATYLFNLPLPLARELPEELLVLVIFMAMPKVMRDDRNVAVDLFMELASPTVQNVGRIFVLGLCMFLFGFLGWQSWFGAIDSFSVRETVPAAYRFPIYPIKFLMCLALFTTALESARLLLQALFARSPGASPAAKED